MDMELPYFLLRKSNVVIISEILGQYFQISVEVYASGKYFFLQCFAI